MSSSTSQQYDTRFNNFSYHTLGLICDFYAEEPQQIIQVFALINKRSNDVIVNHARLMWKRVISSFFPSSGLGESKKKKEDDDDDNDKTYSYDTYHEFVTLASRFSFNPNNSLLSNKYSKTADAKAGFNKRLQEENAVFEKFNHPFVEIEDCGKGNTNDNSSSSSSTVDFKFRCPMLAQNLQLLSEQTKSGLPVLFCDVCQKKVFTVGRSSNYLGGVENSDVPSVQEQLEDAAKHGRCVRIDEDNDALLWMFHRRRPSQIGNSEFSEDVQTVNIGFIVSNDEQADFVRSFFRRMPAAQRTAQRYSGGIRASLAAKRGKFTVPVFVSKNEVLMQDNTTRPYLWRLRIVEHSFDSEAGKYEVDDGSDECQSALGKKHAPSGGGWSYLVVFDGVKIGKGAIDTPLLALQTTGRVHRFVGPAAAIRSDKNNEVKTEDDAAENDTKKESDVSIALPFSLPDHQLYTPTQFFDQLWNKLEKEIINEFKMPAGIMGQVAFIRDVRTSGNTRPLDEKMKPEDKKKPEPGFFSRLFES